MRFGVGSSFDNWVKVNDPALLELAGVHVAVTDQVSSNLKSRLDGD